MHVEKRLVFLSLEYNFVLLCFMSSICVGQQWQAKCGCLAYYQPYMCGVGCDSYLVWKFAFDDEYGGLAMVVNVGFLAMVKEAI